MDMPSKRAALVAIAALTATTASATAALSLPQAAKTFAAARPAFVVPVRDADDDWDGDDDDASDHRRRSHHHRHHKRRNVDAPFTHVESGRRVIVDAPFAQVYVGRHGRHVVAPFVDIWVPRRRSSWR